MIFYRDLRRCPYILGEFGYENWNMQEDLRFAELEKKRQALLKTAKIYKEDHHEKDIRDMAQFVIESLEPKP